MKFKALQDIMYLIATHDLKAVVSAGKYSGKTFYGIQYASDRPLAYIGKDGITALVSMAEIEAVKISPYPS